MRSPQDIAGRFKDAFTRIHHEEMEGIPILNPMLSVETVGFRDYEGHCLGVLVTPWLMNLILVPAEGEGIRVGDKRTFEFPSQNYDFTANEVDGAGTYYAYPIHSPMHEFHYQEHAIAKAEAFLEMLMVEIDPEDRLDEKRLARFLGGEEMEEIKCGECAGPAQVDGEVTLGQSADSPSRVNRREMLRGRFTSSTPSAE